MLDSRSAISCAFIPPSNTRPARYSVRCPGFRPLVLSVHLAPDAAHGSQVAEYLAHEFIKHHDLKWELVGAGQLENSDYVFLTGHKKDYEELRFTRAPTDSNGNPRWVVHFKALNADYSAACKMANSIGGRKYNNRSFGGGIIFQSYAIDETARDISRLTGRNFKAV